MKCRLDSAAAFFFGVGLAAIAGLQTSLARADDAKGAVIATSAAASSSAAIEPLKKISPAANTKPANEYTPAKRYFVEFRARNAASYGHVYVMYGEVNAHKEIIKSQIAGFFPAGDARDCVNCSVFNWTIGHLIFVPSEIGASDGDLEEKYVLARYRVWIDAAQYKKLVAYIKQRQASNLLWNALWKNCVDFGRDVAEFINLKVPVFILTTPENFVTSLSESNGLTEKQLPLKDASGSLRATVDSASKTSLPSAQKPKMAAGSSRAPRGGETCDAKKLTFHRSSVPRLNVLRPANQSGPLSRFQIQFLVIAVPYCD